MAGFLSREVFLIKFFCSARLNPSQPRGLGSTLLSNGCGLLPLVSKETRRVGTTPIRHHITNSFRAITEVDMEAKITSRILAQV